MELWDLATDKLLTKKAIDGLEQVVALPDGCATRAGKVVLIAGPDGNFKKVSFDTAPSALAGGAQLLVAAADKVSIYDASGKPKASFDVSPGVTALQLDQGSEASGGWLVLGYRDGNIELRPTDPAEPLPTHSFEQVPASAPQRILVGPRGTLIIGYANGLVGIWDRREGTLLAARRVHGPIMHLLLAGQRLYAATDLGDHFVWDLTHYARDYCELMGEVWRGVPVSWEEGRPIARTKPETHRCLQPSE